MQSILNVEIREGILNVIIKDSEDNQVEEKRYMLNAERDKVRIMGLVEAYEPGAMWLIFDKVNKKQRIELEALVDDYEFAFDSGASFRTMEESLSIF